jgi:hypothetical protein
MVEMRRLKVSESKSIEQIFNGKTMSDLLLELGEKASLSDRYKHALESIAKHSPSERDREIALKALGRETE